MSELVLTRVALDDPEAQLLIALLDEDLQQRYPEVDIREFQLAPEDLAPGRGAMVLVRRDGTPLGCGAVRLLDAGTAEVKKMYTLPLARRSGVGRLILGELEQIARELGATRLVLETAVRQPEAIALYQRCGFQHIASFHQHQRAPVSRCMAKAL